MVPYRILPHPGANAVFFDASEKLSLAELSLCLSRLTCCGAPSAITLAGARWYAFEAENVLPDTDIRKLSKVSSLYALFQQVGECLLPVEPLYDRPFPESLSAILKYTGKTNALFTRLLLHIAELSLPYAPTSRIRLLDPVAGKGTTLYEALMRGWDAAGIEIVKSAAHDSAVYFQKYLETEKWKHKAQKEKVHGMASWKYTFAKIKQSLKEAPGEWMMIAGDGKLADRCFGKSQFDIVAGDLPYGVSHGNVAGGNLLRSPKALLMDCLPAWHAVLKPRGVIALSFNCLSFPREEMCQLLIQNQFDVKQEPPYDTLSHRVDASIQRDVVIGVKRNNH